MPKTNDVVAMLSEICRRSDVYEYKDYGIQRSGGYNIVIARPVLLLGEEVEFEVNISIFEQQNSLRIVVPLYDKGLVGNKVGGMYQLIAEMSSQIRGNAKIVPYTFDQSNQLTIMLSEDLDRVDKRWFEKSLEELFDTYAGIRPELDRAISRLQLKFDPKARLKSDHLKLIDDIMRSLPWAKD